MHAVVDELVAPIYRGIEVTDFAQDDTGVDVEFSDGRSVLLNYGAPGGFDITPWADRLQQIDARYAGTWELPALGPVTAPNAVLIRPDG